MTMARRESAWRMDMRRKLKYRNAFFLSAEIKSGSKASTH